jgi:hypothetical protein
MVAERFAACWRVSLIRVFRLLKTVLPKATAWALLPAILSAGVPRLNCQCAAGCHAGAKDRSLLVCDGRGEAPIESKQHSCCQQKAHCEIAGATAPYQEFSAAGTCWCRLSVTTSSAVAVKRIDLPKLSEHLGAQSDVCLPAPVPSAGSSALCAHLLGPPPDNLVISLRRLLI